MGKVRQIEVTAEIIGQSLRANSNHCMIADAIKAAMPEAKAVSVDLQTIRYTDREKGQRYVYFTPLVCQQQLLRFDQGVHVHPWSFKLPRNPAQTVKVVASASNQAKSVRPNKTERPAAFGPKQIQNPATGQFVVKGGQAPPTAVLSNARGRVRTFGIRAAKGFDPSQAG